MGTGLLFDFARHHSTGHKLNRKYFDTYEKNDDDFPDLFNAMGPHKIDGLESLFIYCNYWFYNFSYYLSNFWK